ncbi:MAG: hypothetical protein WD628_05850 [Thermomicrobiales bacterium]
MFADLIESLEPSLSAARFARYRPVGEHDDPDLEVIVNYVWNMALADSLYCCLSAVEVALRNTLHTTLADHFGTPTWYSQTGIMDLEQQQQLASATSKIMFHKKPVTPDRLVGEMTFGFWVTILSRNYEARLWRANKSETIKHAFPHVPRKLRKRGSIHEQYNQMRALRNRVSHHEPLFDDIKLTQRHQSVLEGIRWINPELRQLVDRFDRFPEVYANGRSRVESQLKDHLGIP